MDGNNAAMGAANWNNWIDIKNCKNDEDVYPIENKSCYQTNVSTHKQTVKDHHVKECISIETDEKLSFYIFLKNHEISL